MLKSIRVKSRRRPQKPQLRTSRPSRTPHDLAPAHRGKPPQCAQEHRPKDRERKTAIPAQCPQARINRHWECRALWSMAKANVDIGVLDKNDDRTPRDQRGRHVRTECAAKARNHSRVA